MKLVIVVLSLATAVASLCQAASPEVAVRQVDEAWAKAIAAKSVEQTVALYDAEALTAGSAMPPARGLDAIRAMWTKLFARPDFSLTWQTDKVTITESGTTACATGSWSRAGSSTKAPFLAVWRKQPDGKWKVLVDAAWYPPKPE